LDESRWLSGFRRNDGSSYFAIIYDTAYSRTISRLYTGEIMKYSTLALLIVFLLIVCLGNSSAKGETSSNVDIYYPLVPRTMTYDYLKKESKESMTRQVTVYKSRIVHDIEVTPSVMTGADVKYPITRLFQKKANGIYVIGSQLADGSFVKVDTDIPILINPIKDGIFFDSNVSYSLGNGSPLTSHYTYGVDDTNAVITVPYGQFTNCIRLKFTVRGAETTNEVTSWIAPKVGLVKNIEIIKSNRTNSITETEMSLKKVDYSTPVEAAQTSIDLEKKERGTMEWLTNNSVANMKGTDFLLLYITTIVVALLLGWYFIRSAGSTGQEMSLPLPSKPDPYEVAYLRGGVQEVIRLAVFKLIQARCVVSSVESPKIIRVDTPSGQSAMSDMERIVYDYLASPQTMRGICKRLSSEFKERCAPLQQRLYDDRLLNSWAAKNRARFVLIALSAFILGLGGFKLAVALSRGRTNVLFLVVAAVIGFILTIRITRTPRLSRRGIDYLNGLRVKLQGEKNAAAPDLGIEGVYLTLLVALFGFSVLGGTAYAQYVSILAAPASSFSNTSYFGGGCGGGGGGCGGCGGGN
jgi:uncharacterized protein (TIGR04222 family)